MQPLEINALLSVLWFCDTKKAQGALPVLEGAVVLLVLATAPGVWAAAYSAAAADAAAATAASEDTFDAPEHAQYDVTHGNSSYCCNCPDTQASRVDKHVPEMDTADAWRSWWDDTQVIKIIARTTDTHVKMSYDFS
jgi:hypothetical protein